MYEVRYKVLYVSKSLGISGHLKNSLLNTVVVHLSDQAVRGSITGWFDRQAPDASAIFRKLVLAP